jgi:DNA-binding CsgD family transcriptional regulator
MAESGATVSVPTDRVARSTQAMLVVDENASCTQASLGACRLLGLSRSELIGSELSAHLDGASRERFDHIWAAFRATGGHAEPFTLQAAGGAVQVAVTVMPDLLPGSHLVRLDRLTAGRSLATEPPRGERRPTAREREILALLADGATDGQIAGMLALSPTTVQTHVRNAKAKLGATTRTQAVALAIRLGLIRFD